MKDWKFKLGFIACITIIASCSDDGASTLKINNEDDKEPVLENVTAPCSTDSNTCTGLNGEKLSFTSLSAGEDQAFYGNYGIEAVGSMATIGIDFKKEPVTGIYITTRKPTVFDWNDNECVVTGRFGGFYYETHKGKDTLYINKIGLHKYSVDFCKLAFSSSQIQFEFDSKGNITVD